MVDKTTMFNACCKGKKSWSKLRTLTSISNIHGTLITFTSTITKLNIYLPASCRFLAECIFSNRCFGYEGNLLMYVGGEGEGVALYRRHFPNFTKKNQCKSAINESPGHELMSSAVRSDTSLSSNRMRNNENLCIWEEGSNLKQLRSFRGSAKHTV